MPREPREGTTHYNVDQLKLGEGILGHERELLIRVFGHGTEMLRTLEEALINPSLSNERRSEIERVVDEAHRRAVQLFIGLKRITQQEEKLNQLMHWKRKAVLRMARATETKTGIGTEGSPEDQSSEMLSVLRCAMPLDDDLHPDDFAITTLLKCIDQSSQTSEWCCAVELVLHRLQEQRPRILSAEKSQLQGFIYLLDTRLVGPEKIPQFIPVYIPATALKPSGDGSSLTLRRKTIERFARNAFDEKFHEPMPEKEFTWLTREQITMQQATDPAGHSETHITMNGEAPWPFFVQVVPTSTP